MIILPNFKAVIDKKKQLFKILPVGNFTSYNGNARNRIISLNSDSTIDSNFNVGTGFDNVVNAIALQADGKIIAGGIFISYNGTTRNRIARLNTDGTYDTSFNIGSGFDVGVSVNALALQSDGKILVGGNFTAYNGTSSNYIARLNTDGTYDSSFNIGSGFNSTVNALAIK